MSAHFKIKVQQERILGVWQAFLSVRPLWFNFQPCSFPLAHGQKGFVPLWRQRVTDRSVKEPWINREKANVPLWSLSPSRLWSSAAWSASSSLPLRKRESSDDGAASDSGKVKARSSWYLRGCWYRRQSRPPGCPCTSSSPCRPSSGCWSCHLFSGWIWCI